MGLPDLLAVSFPELVIGLLVGGGLTYILQHLLSKQQLAAARQQVNQILDEAKGQAEVIVEKGRIDAEKERIQKLREFEEKTTKVREELKEAERRLEKREDNLDKKLDTLATKERMLDQGEQRLAQKQAAVAEKEAKLEETLADQRSQLLRISGMSVEDARNLLLNRIRHEGSSSIFVTVEFDQ